MKKIIALLTALAMLAVFAPACGKKKTSTGEEEGGRRAKKSRRVKESKESRTEKQAKEDRESSEPVAAIKGGVLYVLVDRGITKDMTDREVTHRNSTGDWMDEDLSRLLRRAGYDAKIVTTRSEAKGGHLLHVRIVKYNPGSAAARAFVGYGAGAASMNIHYELSGGGSSPILSADEGVGSSRDWRSVIRKLDEKMVRAVSDKLAK